MGGSLRLGSLPYHMAKTKVRVLYPSAFPEDSGDEVSIDSSDAQALIALGYAEAVKEPEPKAASKK